MSTHWINQDQNWKIRIKFLYRNTVANKRVDAKQWYTISTPPMKWTNRANTEHHHVPSHCNISRSTKCGTWKWICCCGAGKSAEKVREKRRNAHSVYVNHIFCVCLFFVQNKTSIFHRHFRRWMELRAKLNEIETAIRTIFLNAINVFKISF